MNSCDNTDMTPRNFKIDAIIGLEIEELRAYEDDRGHLIELFRLDNSIQACTPRPEMAYASWTHPDIYRGPHEHKEQTDIFIFADAEFMFFAWDNRRDSETYNNQTIIKTGQDNIRRIVVPPGVVHGYANVSKNRGLVMNCPDKLYAGWNKKDEVDEIRHEEDENNVFVLDMKKHLAGMIN